MMTKEQIFRAVLRAIRQDATASTTAEQDSLDSESYEETVMATLDQRLPDVVFTTYEDFRHLRVACCESCHSAYPHYDMYVEEVEGGKAWVCCSVRFALLALKAGQR